MTTSFDAIRRIVIADPDLMGQFTAAATREELFALVTALGRERGFAVTETELDEVVRANRRSWLERWLFQ